MNDPVAALLETITPANRELLELWAGALAEVGGIYAPMGLDGRLALAAGTAAVLRTLLDGGTLNDAAAGRYVAPPPYRDQPPGEFLLAALNVSLRLDAWFRSRSDEEHVAREASLRVRGVLAEATASILRLKDLQSGPIHLLQALGSCFSRPGPPRTSFGLAAERIAAECGVELCLIATVDAEHLRIYAAHPPGRPLGLTLSDPIPRSEVSWLDFADPEQGWQRVPRVDDGGLDGRLARAGFSRLVAHPLLTAGRFIGVVVIAAREQIRPRTVESLRLAAPLIAAALAQVRQAGALEQAEAALAEVFDSAPTMMCALDRLGRVVRTSRRFRDELGLPDDCVGMPLQWLVHPAWMDRFNDLWLRIQAEQFVEQARVDLITAHGTRLPVSLEARWLRDELGENAICMVGLWNVAALLAREQAQRARIDELNAFAHQVAHDLKAPLRTVTGFAALLQDELQSTASDETRLALDRIRAAAERGDAMVEGILRFARSGGVGKAQPLRIGVLLDNVREALAADLAAQDAEVAVVRDDTALLGDVAALTTLLSNLVGNALRYRSAERPRVAVGVTALSPGWAVLTVRDNGIGVDPADQERIFDLFQRAHPDRPGTGVGLAIVRRVARAHGGEVEVSSTPGEGSMFSVRLPTA
ncbi:ATP-binding protein [Myxococcota bacterium]|nr:ATP-binding protein [Myxococcota bacterium]